MKITLLAISILLLSACSRPCLVCEVIKNGQMIENYQSCEDEGKKVSKEICEEMAKLQNCQCECKEVSELKE